MNQLLPEKQYTKKTKEQSPTVEQLTKDTLTESSNLQYKENPFKSTFKEKVTVTSLTQLNMLEPPKTTQTKVLMFLFLLVQSLTNQSLTDMLMNITFFTDNTLISEGTLFLIMWLFLLLLSEERK